MFKKAKTSSPRHTHRQSTYLPPMHTPPKYIIITFFTNKWTHVYFSTHEYTSICITTLSFQELLLPTSLMTVRLTRILEGAKARVCIRVEETQHRNVLFLQEILQGGFVHWFGRLTTLLIHVLHNACKYIHINSS